jgi:hypothetical protein
LAKIPRDAFDTFAAVIFKGITAYKNKGITGAPLKVLVEEVGGFLGTHYLRGKDDENDEDGS